MPDDKAKFRAPDRHPRRPAARVGAVAARSCDVRRAGRALRLRPGRHADLRAHRGVPAGGGVHRRRQQGDVRLRRQGRAPPRAAARGHRVGRAGVRAAPPDGAVEGLVRRAELPLRAPAEGPVPPALAARRRGARRRRPRRRRRGHRARRTASTATSGSRASRSLLNSMGDARRAGPRTSALLREYLLDHAGALGDDFRERVEANPLRVLDSKRADWQDVIERAPQLTEHLCDASRDALRAGAARAATRSAIAYELAPRLVRGFDYYTAPRSSSRATRSTRRRTRIGGGGRYDGLAEEMGGPPTPGIGFGIGIERVAARAATRRASIRRRRAAARRVRRRRAGRRGDSEVTVLVTELREDGLRAERAYGDRSVKAQWKVADRSGARFGVMLGRARGRAGRGRGEGPRIGRAGGGAARAARRLAAGTTRAEDEPR